MYNEALLPKKGSRVVVAMSGGVDSSVSAGWLKQMGYDVIGISLQLHDMAESVENKFGTCCSLSDISDARRVAEKLDIPFYVANMESEFDAAVIDDFVHEYLNGRTPNPCIRCNEKVKFRHLMDWALDLGADFLATGHYAQVRQCPETKRYRLYRGQDPEKDQSYFLFTLQEADLARTLFPVGSFAKKDVRELARKLELGVADKPDSQEICFVQARNYKDFIESRVPASLLKPGPMVDTKGKVVGQHNGLHQFTLGQRKGIGVASREPLFVIELRPETNEVVVGEETHLFKKSCTVAGMNWLCEPRLDNPTGLTAKIRYRAKDTGVEVFPLVDNRVEIRFADPQRAITPGQALVLYRENEVVGGGWIEDIVA